MDADTRHQLKQNELAEMLAKLRHLRDRRFLYAAAGVGLVLVIIGAVYAWRASQASAAEQSSQRLGKILDDLQSKEGEVQAGAERDLRALIASSAEPGVAGYARLTLARALVDRGHRDPAERDPCLGEARQLLEQVRGNAQSPPMLAAAATLLLATVQESLRDVAAAEQLYRELTTNARFAGSPAIKVAEKRLESLEKARVAINLLPGMPPEATSPAGGPEPAKAMMDIESLRSSIGGAPGTPLSAVNRPAEQATPVRPPNPPPAANPAAPGTSSTPPKSAEAPAQAPPPPPSNP